MSSIRIVTDSEATSSARTVSIPIARSQNGTKLVVDTMRLAIAQDVDLVGDIGFSFATTSGSQRLRCTTSVIAANPGATPVRAGSNWRGPLRKVTRLVREREFVCGREIDQVITRPGDTIGDAAVQSWADCRFRVVERFVSRYAFQFEAEFVPPDWRHLSRLFADVALEEGAATCRPVGASDPGGNFLTLRLVRFRHKQPVLPDEFSNDTVWRPAPMAPPVTR